MLDAFDAPATRLLCPLLWVSKLAGLPPVLDKVDISSKIMTIEVKGLWLCFLFELCVKRKKCRPRRDIHVIVVIITMKMATIS